MELTLYLLTSYEIKYFRKLTRCVCVSEGFVVANDNDNKRCYLMVHQVRRLASPNFLVMNMNAAILPAFTLQVWSHISCTWNVINSRSLGVGNSCNFYVWRYCKVWTKRYHLSYLLTYSHCNCCGCNLYWICVRNLATVPVFCSLIGYFVMSHAGNSFLFVVYVCFILFGKHLKTYDIFLIQSVCNGLVWFAVYKY